MREISLHIIDIVENSIAAKAKLINIEISEDNIRNLLYIRIADDGNGMSEEQLENVKDPFTTSRKTRRVGLGLSLFEAACNRCGGYLHINSKLNKGTEVIATMELKNIDRAPLGRMEETICTLILNKNIDIVYKHNVDDKEFIFDTRDIKKVAGEDLSIPEIVNWISEYVLENLEEIGSNKW